MNLTFICTACRHARRAHHAAGPHCPCCRNSMQAVSFRTCIPAKTDGKAWRALTDELASRKGPQDGRWRTEMITLIEGYDNRLALLADRKRPDHHRMNRLRKRRAGLVQYYLPGTYCRNQSA